MKKRNSKTRRIGVLLMVPGLLWGAQALPDSGSATDLLPTSTVAIAKKTYDLSVQDVESIHSAIRGQLVRMFRLQDQTLSLNRLQGWLVSSEIILDQDPEANKLVVRILSSSEMPLLGIPKDGGASAQAVELHGMKGLQFYADKYIGSAVLYASYEDRPDIIRQRMVRIGEALKKRLDAHQGFTFAPDIDHAGLGILSERVQAQKAADSWDNPSQCGQIGTGRAWVLNGHYCFVIDDQTSVVPCAYHDTHTRTILMNPDGALHTADSEVTSKALSWTNLQCGTSSMDIAARLVWSFPTVRLREKAPPQYEPCTLGEPGCNAEELMGPAWKELNMNRGLYPRGK